LQPEGTVGQTYHAEDRCCERLTIMRMISEPLTILNQVCNQQKVMFCFCSLLWEGPTCNIVHAVDMTQLLSSRPGSVYSSNNPTGLLKCLSNSEYAYDLITLTVSPPEPLRDRLMVVIWGFVIESHSEQAPIQVLNSPWGARPPNGAAGVQTSALSVTPF
jgi:hypothetical protein